MAHRIHNYQFVRVVNYTKGNAKIKRAEFMCVCGKVVNVPAKYPLRAKGTA